MPLGTRDRRRHPLERSPPCTTGPAPIAQQQQQHQEGEAGFSFLPDVDAQRTPDAMHTPGPSVGPSPFAGFGPPPPQQQQHPAAATPQMPPPLAPARQTPYSAPARSGPPPPPPQQAPRPFVTPPPRAGQRPPPPRASPAPFPNHMPPPQPQQPQQQPCNLPTLPPARIVPVANGLLGRVSASTRPPAAQLLPPEHPVVLMASIPGIEDPTGATTDPDEKQRQQQVRGSRLLLPY